MNIFAGVLLLVFACSAEQNKNKEEAQIKRGIEHSSNFALLNNLNIESKPAGLGPGGNTINVGNFNTPSGANVEVTYNTENLGLPLANPPPHSNEFSIGYAPASAYAPSYAHPPLSLTGVNIAPNVPLNYENIGYALPQTQIQGGNIGYALPQTQIQGGNIGYALPQTQIQGGNIGYALPQPQIQGGIQDHGNIVQNVISQGPQPYPVQLIKEVQVPQPYPVHITRTVQVPVHVRVPVEVPKPYEVKVPHPVPVPVHIRIPVPVAKPYPVHVTKNVPVPVEKLVYIRVPQPIQVPVPQPYPVPVPQPVQIRVPYPVIIGGPAGSGAYIPSEITNLSGSGSAGSGAYIPPELSNLSGAAFTGEINTALSGGLNATPGILGVPSPTQASLVFTSALPTEPLPPVSATGSDKDSTKPQVAVKPSLGPIKGNGLLPPLPPARPEANQNLLSGLLNSYVASKEGGVFRRQVSQYQTAEYQKTW